METKKQMREYIDTLNSASADYYNGGTSNMSDHDWDIMFDKLKEMEKNTGIVYPDSPTQIVGTPVKVDGLLSVQHEFAARSLDKTKDISVFPEIFKKRADQSFPRDCRNICIRKPMVLTTISLYHRFFCYKFTSEQ